MVITTNILEILILMQHSGVLEVIHNLFCLLWRCVFGILSLPCSPY